MMPKYMFSYGHSDRRVIKYYNRATPLSELVDYTYILHKGTGDLTSAGSIFASIGLSVRLSASDWFMVA